MIRGYSFLLSCVLSLVSLGAVHAADAPLAAKVNGVGITEDRLDKTFEVYLQQQGIQVGAIRNPDQYKALKRQALDILIDQELLWQDAEKKGITASQEEVDQVLAKAIQSQPSREVFLEKLEQSGFTEEGYKADLKHRLSANQLVQNEIVKDISVSDEEVHEFYVANPASFKKPESVHARHILIKVDSAADEATKEAAKQRIDGILAEAKGDADFAELAKKHSEGPSGPKGGDLGFFARGQMIPAFEVAAFALQPAQISGVVETSFGYHIIKMEERKGEQQVPETEVKEQVRQYLVARKTQEALQKYTGALREKGDVQVIAPL